MKVSYSDIAAFSRCRFLYQATRLRKWPEPDTTPKLLGTLVHIGMAAHLLGNKAILAINDAWSSLTEDTGLEQAQIDLMAQTAITVVNRAIDFLASKWTTQYYPHHDAKGSTPMVEYPVQTLDRVSATMRFAGAHDALLWTEHLEVNGVVDWVAVEKETGAVWLFDFKTRTNLEADSTDDYNLQMAMYQYMLRQIGIPVVGSVCMQIRTVVPQRPKMNKDRTMSRTDIITDWSTYRHELVIHGLNPLEYVDMQLKLEQKQFFRLTKTYRNQETLDNIWQQVVLRSSKEMLELQQANADPQYQAPRSMTGMCKICGINERCLNLLHGIDDDIEIVFEENSSATNLV